jgi:hypothetical protein
MIQPLGQSVKGRQGHVARQLGGQGAPEAGLESMPLKTRLILQAGIFQDGLQHQAGYEGTIQGVEI